MRASTHDLAALSATHRLVLRLVWTLLALFAGMFQPAIAADRPHRLHRR